MGPLESLKMTGVISPQFFTVRGKSKIMEIWKPGTKGTKGTGKGTT